MGKFQCKSFLVFNVLVVLLTVESCWAQSSTDDCFGNVTTTETEAASFLTNSELLDSMDFSLDLFHKLYKRANSDNLFFSPYSVHQTLLLAYFASKGETQKQLQNALHIDDHETSKAQLVQLFKLNNFFQDSRAQQVDLKLLTRLYVDDEEEVRPCAENIFSNEVERIDFNTVNTTDVINEWVEESTNGKIKQVLEPGSIRPESKIAMVNTAYFKGKWSQQFKESKTKMGLFYVSKKDVQLVPMMSQKGSFRHGISEKLRSYILELPYEDEALSMFILLPPFVPNAIEETVKRLNSSVLREAMDEMIQDAIDVMLPKFNIEQTLDLTKNLESLGVSSLFTDNSDLSDFFPTNGLKIDTAVHKSYVEVNEEGSTAAAVTSLIGTRSGRPLDQTRFLCNHPFLFFIFDNKSKNILFMGALHRPT